MTQPSQESREALESIVREFGPAWDRARDSFVLAGGAGTSVGRQMIVKAWLRCSKQLSGSQHSFRPDEDLWADMELNQLLSSSPVEGWQIIDDILAVDSTPDTVRVLIVGPFETLLGQCDESATPRILELAARYPVIHQGLQAIIGILPSTFVERFNGAV